jgi:hypothetical protein
VPTVVRALSGDTTLLDRFREGPAGGTVHSSFDRVVNVTAASDGQLLTLAASSVDDAPATLRLDLGSLAQLGLRPGDHASWRPDRLSLGAGRVLVDLTPARRWTSRLPDLPMPTSSLQWLRTRLDTWGVPGGALPGVAASGTMEAAVNDLITANLSGLIEALRTDDAPAVTRRAGQLIGLGTGLTPAGDDALLGVTLVAAMPASRLAPMLAPLADVITASAGRTHVISHAALTQATRGRTRDVVVRLLHAMADNAAERSMATRFTHVTAIGHTSGTDILTGLSAALDLDHELRGAR